MNIIRALIIIFSTNIEYIKLVFVLEVMKDMLLFCCVFKIKTETWYKNRDDF